MGVSPLIPFAVICGNRHQYLVVVLEALEAAVLHAEGPQSLGKRDCFFIIDLDTNRMADAFRQDMETVLDLVQSVSFCTVHVLPHLYKGVMPRSANLKKNLLWNWRAVWEQLPGYDGDVLFLEDDVVPSLDIFVAFEFASHVKGQSHMAQTIAMGGWAGENFVNADPLTFIEKTTQNFPTCAFGFNRTLWDQIRQVWEKVVDDTRAQNDWCGVLMLVLWERAKEVNGAGLPGFTFRNSVRAIAPTLSRYWHIGAASSVGVKSAMKNVQKEPTWLNQRLLRPTSSAGASETPQLLPHVRDWLGFPCPRDWLARAAEENICRYENKNNYPNKLRYTITKIDFEMLAKYTSRLL